MDELHKLLHSYGYLRYITNTSHCTYYTDTVKHKSALACNILEVTVAHTDMKGAHTWIDLNVGWVA